MLTLEGHDGKHYQFDWDEPVILRCRYGSSGRWQWHVGIALHVNRERINQDGCETRLLLPRAKDKMLIVAGESTAYPWNQLKGDRIKIKAAYWFDGFAKERREILRAQAAERDAVIARVREEQDRNREKAESERRLVSALSSANL